MAEPSRADPPHPRQDIPPRGPVLAIDWGMRHIGLALSDPDQRLAHPLATIHRRRGRRFPMAQLREHLERERPVGIVVGLPLDELGREGSAARAARDAGDLVGVKTGLPVAYRDERMTTARVRRARRETGRPGGGAADRIDALAATVLLQHFLDSRR